MRPFEHLGLSPRALDAVEALGYREPTPVQERAIPLVLSGRDIIAAAKTGTGKTAAFSLPIFDKLDHAGYGAGPLALVVTPTRELAMQIDEVCRTIAKRTKHRVVCLVGGVSYGPQVEKLERGCDVIISTPGRLLDLIGQGAAHLDQVQTLVLDEADRMLDMGFLPDVRRIVGKCPKQRQTLLFSATIDASIEKNLANLLNDPAYVEIDPKGQTADLIDQYRIDVDHRMKQNLLHALLNEKGGCRIIVFARTRYRVDACVRKLRRAGFNVLPIHSDRTQNQRKRAIDAFAADEVDILVATDVLARGIDIAKVNYVVNFDLPTQAEDYVHRIGRTGRAGERGFAVSFVAPENAQEIREIEKLIGREIPYMQLAWDGSEESEAAIVARANRKAARKDPEIASVVREQKAKQKRAVREADSEGERGDRASERAQTPKKHAKPGRPAKPGKPGKPGKPVKPGKPGKPGKPSKPGKPAQPGKPARTKGRPGKPSGGNAASGNDFRSARGKRRDSRKGR